LFGAVAAFAPAFAAGAPAPLKVEGPPASAAILHDLKSFREMGTVLHIGAHPDDENTELITWLSRGRGYRTGYLSITRGDGGQNELGRDFDEKLGVARTQELLAARRQDGGRQFFTRAIDFGFSKSPEETLRIWDRDQVLGDVVRVIRQFRPDVIVTRFPIPPGSGGHGHHTASAILAVEAFKLAGDPKAYPEQLAQGLTVWQPKRVLWNIFRFGNATSPLNGPTFQMDIAGTDDVTGESFGTIAARSRAMHKTQGLGGFTNRTGNGPNMQSFMLLAGDAATKDLMDEVDLTWSRVPGGGDIGRLADEALAQFKADDPAASVPALLAIRAKLAALPTDPLLADKRTQLDHLIFACVGLSAETTVPQAEVVPGESLHLRHSVVEASSYPVHWVGLRFPAVNADLHSIGSALVAGSGSTRESAVVLPAGTPPSQPYWLRDSGTAGMFRVDDPALIGRPDDPPAFPVEYIFELGGQTLVLAGEPVQIVPGAPTAQARRRVAVIPPVSLQFGSEIFLIAPGASKSVTVELAADRAKTRGVLRLEVPAGWQVAPTTQDFSLANTGDQARVTFKVTAAAAGLVPSSSDRVTAVAEVDGHRYSNQRYEIRYDHLPVQLLQPPARARVASFALATRGFTVGYLPGAGDYVAECLEQMGYVVQRLTGTDLTPEKLKGLDAVVIGVRAFNERTDLKAALPGLFAWVEAGGTVITQYNRPNGLKADQLGPYPLSIEGPAPQLRVTDEQAPVTFLASDHAALNGPNKIGPDDFAGWVQERGAYFPSSWDNDHYTALLAMSDPGEAPLKSSVLVARYGKGYYVYTGLAFFRQLPAGVSGAYRLFANLISLGK
jgi:LmbE family N-acetylglucosaminyl deacetylase